MPRTSSSSGTPRADLLPSYHEFDPAAQGLVALDAFPALSVPEYQGDYGKVPAESLLRNFGEDIYRVSGATAVGTDFEYQPGSYHLREMAVKAFIDIQDAERYGSWDDLESLRVQSLRGDIERSYEQIVASTVFDGSTFGTTAEATVAAAPGDYNGFTAATKFSVDTGDPIAVVELARECIFQQTGLDPNAVILPRPVAFAISNSPAVLDRLRYRTEGVPDAMLPIAEIARVLGVEHVHIARSSYHNGADGEDFKAAGIWNATKMLVFRRSDGGDLGSGPHMLRTLVLDGDAEVAITTSDIPDPQGRLVVARTRRQAHMVHKELGCLVSGVL